MSDQEPPRHPRNLQGLLQLCASTQIEGSSLQQNATLPMDFDRRHWLENVLSSMTVNTVEEIKKSLYLLKECWDARSNGTASETTYADMEDCIEKLIDFTCSLDNAVDFAKLDGFKILVPFLSIPEEKLKSKAAELVAELVQNDAFCQNEALRCGLLPVLLEIVDSEQSEVARVKAFYALSCLLRQNLDAQRRFEELDGFSVLLRTLQSPALKLRMKTAFLLTALCNQQPLFKDTLCDMGFVEQVVALLHGDHDESHEHLLSSLLALITHHEPSRKECQRPELRLKNVVEQHLQLVGDEFREVKDYCNQINNLCFHGSDERELER